MIGLKELKGAVATQNGRAYMSSAHVESAVYLLSLSEGGDKSPAPQV